MENLYAAGRTNTFGAALAVIFANRIELAAHFFALSYNQRENIFFRKT